LGFREEQKRGSKGFATWRRQSFPPNLSSACAKGAFLLCHF
jgi:hypothetical protein